MTGGRARAAGPAAEGSTVDWEHFAHGADIGVRGFGAGPAQAFEHAALALTAVVTEPAHVRQVTAVAIRCRAPDLDLLLYEWLTRVSTAWSTSPGRPGWRARWRASSRSSV